MFTKKEYLEILTWIHAYILRNPHIYLLQQVPVAGVKDYSVGDLTRMLKKFRGEDDVVRAYEKIKELLVLRQLENKDLDASTRNKLTEETFTDMKVGSLVEIDEAREKKLSDSELEKKMNEMGWYRKVGV